MRISSRGERRTPNVTERARSSRGSTERNANERNRGDGRAVESFNFINARELPEDILQEEKWFEQDLADRISLIFAAHMSGQQQTWPQIAQSAVGLTTEARSGAAGNTIARIKRYRKTKRMNEI